MARECTRGVVHTEVMGVFRTPRQVARPGAHCQKRADITHEGLGGAARHRARTTRGGGGGLTVVDMAVSEPLAPAYLSDAQTPLGCASKREGAKDTSHLADVTRAGNTFVPCVLESFGAWGARGREWLRGMLDMAEVVDDVGDPLIGDAMVWAKAQLGERWLRLQW